MQEQKVDTEDLNRMARLIARALNDVPTNRNGHVTLTCEFRDDVVSHLLRLTRPEAGA